MSSQFSQTAAEAQMQVTQVFSSESKFCFDRDCHGDQKIYLVSSDLSAIECLEIIRQKKVKTVLQNSLQTLSDKLGFLKKVDDQRDVYFSENLSFLDAEMSLVKFSVSDLREHVIEKAFTSAAIDLDMTKYQYVFQVALELVMNAQIDAPKLSNQTLTQNPSMLICEKNLSKGLVAISVIDHYGSLDCYKMLENIYLAHKNGFRDSMSKNSVGAGLGSALIYEYSDSLFVGVIPGQMTRVTAILPYAVSEKKINQIQKSIHIIKG